MSAVRGHELRAALTEVHVYVVTPFTDDLDAIRTDDLAAHLSGLVDRGVRVVAVGGGTGEADALSPSEQEELVSVALDTVGDRALVVGCLPGNLGEAVPLARRYETLGLRVALGMAPLVRGRPVVTPEAISGYFEALTARVSIPIMPYNNQSWPVEIILRLADNKGIVAVKDACLDPHPMFQAIQRLGDRFVWIGNKKHDPALTHLRYRLGMEAFTSGMANVLPELELALHAACRRGDDEQALRLQSACASFENLRGSADDAAAVKAAMDIVGYQGGHVRPPRRDVCAEVREDIARVLAELKAPIRRAD